MRLLVSGDLAATGFGTVTRDLGRALIELGHDLRFLSINELGDTEEPFASRIIDVGSWLGPQTDFVDMGRAALAFVERLRGLFETGIGDWKPDAALVIGDPASVIHSGALEWIPATIPTYHYVPIEGVGLPPSWKRIWERWQPVAMCRFGADEIEKLTGSRPPFVYHGVDTTDFFPVSAQRPLTIRTDRAPYLHVLRSKEDCKALFGWPPDSVILYRADRNMPRKRYGTMLRAVAPVLGRHLAFMVMHCRTIDEGGNLDDFRSFYHPAIAARMMTTGFHDRGAVADRKILNAFYNAADITLSTGAEGFGLTIAESLAAGTPVIGMDFSAVPEVIGPAGVVVPVAYYVENIYAYAWAGIDEPKFTEAVEFLVTHKTRRRELGRLGPPHVAANFSWSKAAEQFAEIMSVKEALAA